MSEELRKVLYERSGIHNKQLIDASMPAYKGFLLWLLKWPEFKRVEKGRHYGKNLEDYVPFAEDYNMTEIHKILEKSDLITSRRKLTKEGEEIAKKLTLEE